MRRVNPSRSKMILSKGKTKYLRDLQDEIGDVMTMIEIMKMSGLVTDEQIADRMVEKKEKINEVEHVV